MPPRGWLALVFALVLAQVAPGGELPLPPRPSAAPGATELVRRWRTLDLAARERAISAEILAGNVPDFLRRLGPISITNAAAGVTNVAVIEVAPDYLAVGSDADYLLVPLSPSAAQRLADALNCCLPTRKVVDLIYAAATLKLAPEPIPPSAAMATLDVFARHNALVWTQREASLPTHPLGGLTAGHKKDVVISARLAANPGKVAIYGWHQTNGVPIQPLYLGHAATWVDYSQCVRLVNREVRLNGEVTTLPAVLTNPAVAGLLSDEGVISDPRYPSNEVRLPPAPPAPATNAAGAAVLPSWHWAADADERNASCTLSPGISLRLNLPVEDPGGKVLLILYALPNGNTTAQTFGKRLEPDDDWHFDIQHIGAQTRFLRRILRGQTVVVAYLENDLKSWPAWRKQHGDALLPGVVTALQDAFPARPLDLVLTGHSGGGSFIFGFLNAVNAIPTNVVRIAFLDSNYAYDPALGHGEKLARWLNADPDRRLCVLAYDDANALLDGKPFVSAAGGTWGKSHEMLRDSAGVFTFTSRTNAGLEEYSALEGRIRFLLKENPERKILHTVQVERNGFIHALLTGTRLEGGGYEYLGERAYRRFIR